MENDYLFLKANVVFEPLIEKWYAWPHIISPGTAAMNILKRHLEIMNSYIEDPESHVDAVKNPMMLGGPFMDFSEKNRVKEIQRLLDDTLNHQGDLIQFSLAIQKLDVILKGEPKGFSLENVYSKVPEILKGYVELVYDLNNNVSFRLYEQLLYKSKFYKKHTQSIALWLTDNDSRPFCLSTPKLDSEEVLFLDIPFDHEIIDKLSKMRREGGSFSEIKAMIGSEKIKDEKLLRSFFTDEKPLPYNKYKGDKIRMRYFGHACILIETNNLSILIDPLISYYGYQSDVEHFSDFDLPDVIDYILITHNHQDHILLETLLPLRHKTKNIIVPNSGGGALQDPNLKLMFNNIGFDNVIEIGELQNIEFIDCIIKGIPFMGEHSDLDIKSKLCYHVKIEEFSLLFVADSRVLEAKLYEHVHNEVGDVDVLFLGMECDGAPLSWLYGPLLLDTISKSNDSSRRLAGSDFKKGMHLVDIFMPSEVYVYAMGQEPWCEFISSIKYTPDSNPIIQSDFLVSECLKRGLVSERLFGEKEILYSRITPNEETNKIK